MEKVEIEKTLALAGHRHVNMQGQDGKDMLH